MIMNTKKDIQDKIDNTLNSISKRNDLKASPFFKDKTMLLLFSEKKKEHVFLAWFTPKFQLATLLCFIVLNLVAFTQMNTSSTTENILDFAETHGLMESEDIETVYVIE